MAVLLPVVERAARLALNVQGIASRNVQTRDCLVHVYEARGGGTLPTTVLLHGIGSAATPFGPVLTRLRPHAKRVFAPDLPGHGFSAPLKSPQTPQALYATLCETLQPLAAEPFVLVGNSLGGALALRYAIEHPRRVISLVLVSPAGAQLPQAEWDALLQSFRIDNARDARRLLARLYHRMPFYMPAFARDVHATFSRETVRGILSSASQDDLPAPERLRELPMPVLLLWGQSERIFPASALAYFRKHLPAHAVIERPAGFGHCPHFDNPGGLSRRVLTFLREHHKGASHRRASPRR